MREACYFSCHLILPEYSQNPQTSLFFCCPLLVLAYANHFVNGRDFRVTERTPAITTAQPSEGRLKRSLTSTKSTHFTLNEFMWLFFVIEGMVRLVGGQHQCEGRVEMYSDSGWGTVCDDAWDLPDAQVVCHQLGCGEATVARREAFFGPGIGTILLDNLKCTGAEASLQECSHISWNVHNCDHSEDAGVTCSLSWFPRNHTPIPAMGRKWVYQPGTCIHYVNNSFHNTEGILHHQQHTK